MLTLPCVEATEQADEKGVGGKPKRCTALVHWHGFLHCVTAKTRHVHAVMDDRHRAGRPTGEFDERIGGGTRISDQTIDADLHGTPDQQQMQAAEVVARNDVVHMPDRGFAMQYAAKCAQNQGLLCVRNTILKDLARAAMERAFITQQRGGWN
jgi:hypothetical protein